MLQILVHHPWDLEASEEELGKLEVHRHRHHPETGVEVGQVVHQEDHLGEGLGLPEESLRHQARLSQRGET